MKQEVECNNCHHEFFAELYKNGYCPKCGKTFIWDSSFGEPNDEYFFPDWEPGFLPEFMPI